MNPNDRTGYIMDRFSGDILLSKSKFCYPKQNDNRFHRNSFRMNSEANKIYYIEDPVLLKQWTSKEEHKVVLDLRKLPKFHGWDDYQIFHNQCLVLYYTTNFKQRWVNIKQKQNVITLVEYALDDPKRIYRVFVHEDKIYTVNCLGEISQWS